MKCNQLLKRLFSCHTGYIFLLFLVSLLGYGAFLKYAPIYDFNNFFFPYRYSVVDAIHQHCLPFWNPYQAMGIPAHADPQSGVFYLPVWLFALIFGKYTTVCCGAEFIFHTFVGGAGFYLLAHHFTQDRVSAFVTASCYLLSGFFVGNAQHLVWIISAAWLPWVVYYFIQLFEKPGWRATLLFPIAFSFMLTGGYPGFIFVTFYLLLCIAVFYWIDKYINDKTSFKRILPWGLAAFILTLLICSPALFSFFEIQPEITRGEALAFDNVACPITLQSLSSLIFPYLVNSDPAFSHTDLSMGSIYMGLLMLPMLIIGLMKNRNCTAWVLFGFGVLCFLLAFGQALPFNKFIVMHVPFLSLIRLAGLYRLFFILPALLIAGIGLKCVLADWENYKKGLLITSLALGIIFFITAIVAGRAGISSESAGWLGGTLCQKVVVEALIAGVTMLAFAGCGFFLKNPSRVAAIVVLMLIEPMVQAHICGPKTIYDKNMDLSQLERATSVEGFPIPDSLKSAEKIIQLRDLTSLWTNVGMFVKEVEYHSCSPVKLYRNVQMLRLYYETVTPLYLPLAYLPKSVVCDTSAHFLNADTAYSNTFEQEGMFPSACDSVAVVCFRPGQVVMRTHTSCARPVVLCQNVYHGWIADVDGQVVHLDTLNHTMQSVMAPAGDHTITLRYHRPLLIVLFILQISLTAVPLCGIIFARLRRKKE